ncbi:MULTISPECIES: hypothetical protein [unclassified Methylobacterium]|uniref:hypothetical protein n=1 Tax=unclassified Methylobacterium TaxID=2615210 RepID=UPI0006F4A976|nr:MULTISPECIES: hypothetical protein [unclassified Methylobacterium]KQP77555.1 hypothetical protein ASF60_06075 [Methylobacterium sp. Leaf113]MCK2053625.1 hypothetical protein [Methylobacterium sp. 37f]
MSDAIRNLMDVILRGIVEDEGFARELADAAFQLGSDDDLVSVQVLCSLSRQHRVRAIKGRAELAALAERYIRGECP